MSSASHIRLLLFVALTALVGAIVVPTAAAGAQAPTCFGRVATIVATPGGITVGTPGADVIVGTPGNDIIRGKGGADYICAGGGRDKVSGGHGSDVIDLGSGEDIGRGGRGHDVVQGGDGSDTIKGRSGRDTIRGGAGVDTCHGGRGRDTLESCNEPATAALSSSEAQVVNLVQDLRAQYGAGRLEVSVDMSEVARVWSAQLPDDFRHNPSVASQVPGGWRTLGENIAYNASVGAAFDALVDSPGHLRNMVNSGFTHLGVGVHVENGRVYVTQVFASY